MVGFLIPGVAVIGLVTLIFFLVSDVLLGKKPDESEVVSKAVSKTEQIEAFVNQLPPNEIAKQQLITEMHLRNHLERIDGNVLVIVRTIYWLWILSVVGIGMAVIFFAEKL